MNTYINPLQLFGQSAGGILKFTSGKDFFTAYQNSVDNGIIATMEATASEFQEIFRDNYCL